MVLPVHEDRYQPHCTRACTGCGLELGIVQAQCKIACHAFDDLSCGMLVLDADVESSIQIATIAREEGTGLEVPHHHVFAAHAHASSVLCRCLSPEREHESQ